jgi:hypothetical protein
MAETEQACMPRTSGSGLDNRAHDLASCRPVPERRSALALRVRVRLTGGEAGEAVARAQGQALWAIAAALGLDGGRAGEEDQ